jgi:alkanesulfonate monooxygenase SsuD/methylene tetrahydromethanopterin reductase-like flavin-dependent oxidoreductase (luciferase family)
VTSSSSSDQPTHSADLRLGLFDIMQVDPVLKQEPAEMYRRRLDDLGVAEESGMDAAFVAERHFLRQHVTPSATAWVAAASQRTSRLRLGMLGYTLPIRQPVQLAEEIAEVDQLCGGRIDVGFGLGHRIEELVALGVDPDDRIRLFQERLAVMQALWSGGHVSMDGNGVTMRDVAIWPLPQQEPYPPLWFAGTEPVAAHWMGSRGLGLAVGFKPTEQLAGAVTAWRAGCVAQPEEMRAVMPERPLGALALMRHVYIAESRERALDEITDDLVRLNDVVSAENGEGSRADRRREAGEKAEELIAANVMIAGGPDDVSEMIRSEREKLGFDLLLANPYAAGVEQERVQRTMRLLPGAVRERLAGASVGT